METPHGVDAVIMTQWWTKLTNKDFQHSITSLGVGVCKVNPIPPNVNKLSSLCIRPPSQQIAEVLFNDHFNQVLGNVQRTFCLTKTI